MARKGSSPKLHPASLNADQMRAAISRLGARVSELRQMDIASISKGDDPKVTGLSARIASTLSQIYGEDTHEFERLGVARQIDDTYYPMIVSLGSGDSGPTVTQEDIREGLARGRDRAVALLQAEVDALDEALQHSGTLSGSGRTAAEAVAPNDEIFVVHGRDTPAKIEVARLIERAGLKAVVLHEQPNAGRTIIEKFEAHGGAAGFAVELLTPDDVGGSSPSDLRPRARQNVIGEMFWFAGRLGRSRVCALKKGDIELPSDFAGVGWVDMDDRGAWKAELLKELNAAGYQVDWSRAMA